MDEDVKTNASDESVVAETSTEVSVLTAKQINYCGNLYSPVWETEGLKIPMIIRNLNGSNTLFYMRIPREEVIKMFKDINEELSHT